MPAISFVVRDGCLIPEKVGDLAAFNDRFGEGEVIETELRPAQSDGQRRFWAMVNAAFKEGHLDRRWSSLAVLADAVKIAAKHRDAGEMVSGTPYWVGRSLADVKDWEAFNAAVLDVLTSKLGVDAAILAPPDRVPVDPQTVEPFMPFDGATLKECMDKFITYGIEASTFSTKDALATIDTLESIWKEALPGDANFVRRCADGARKILADQNNTDKVRKLLRAQLPTEAAHG